MLVLLLLPLVGRGAEVEGVTIEDSAYVGAQRLLLNGAGLRIKFFHRIYATGLYLTEKVASTSAALAQKGPKRISMVLMRDITAQQLIDALNEGIRDNHAPSEVEALKPRAEQLNAIMTAIGIAKTGSLITLDYVPDAGTLVGLNGKPQGRIISGEDFYRALLRIWLGDDPVDHVLKNMMLGRSD